MGAGPPLPGATSHYPLTTPFGPWDVTATLFSALGIDSATHYQDALGRPYAMSDGKVMEAIYGS